MPEGVGVCALPAGARFGQHLAGGEAGAWASYETWRRTERTTCHEQVVSRLSDLTGRHSYSDERAMQSFSHLDICCYPPGPRDNEEMN
jgi:hypothetical protein